MRLLLDTHAFLFAIAEPELLTAKTRRLLTNPSVERWVSAVSLWEIAVKVHIGKLAMPLDRAFYIRLAEPRKDDLPRAAEPVNPRAETPVPPGEMRKFVRQRKELAGSPV